MFDNYFLFFPEDTVVINTRHFLQRLEIHYTHRYTVAWKKLPQWYQKRRKLPQRYQHSFSQNKNSKRIGVLVLLLFTFKHQNSIFFCHDFYCFYFHCICYLTCEFTTTKYYQFLVIYFCCCLEQFRICAKKQIKCGYFVWVPFNLALPNDIKFWGLY